MDFRAEMCYRDIKSLLTEICDFLQKTSKNLSPVDRKLAHDLIERSKKQLIQLSNNSSDYVDMKPNKQWTPVGVGPPLPLKNVPLPPVKKKERVACSEYTNKVTKQQLQLTEGDDFKCPFKDLPAKDSSTESKYGTLIFGKKKLFRRPSKVYACIQDTWLLIYYTNKDAKPFCTLNLRQYEAKNEQNEDLAKKTETHSNEHTENDTNKIAPFVVYSRTTPQKKFMFSAMTNKDRLQWTHKINELHSKSFISTIPIINTQPVSLTINSRPTSADDSAIYQKIAEYRNSTPLPIPDIPPKLPDKPKASFEPSPASSEECLYTDISRDENTSNSSPVLEENEPDYCTIEPIMRDPKGIPRLQLLLTKPQLQIPRPKKDSPDNFSNNNTTVPSNEPRTSPVIPIDTTEVSEIETVEESNPSTPEDDCDEEYVQCIVNKQVKKPTNVMTIIIRKNSPSNEQSNNFETFSRTSKIETFQASPTKEAKSLLKQDPKDSHTLPATNTAAESEIPMVLLKPNIEEKKQPKKKPTIPNKPKLCGRKFF